MNSVDVCVVGSCGVDMFVYSDQMPVAGETVKGSNFFKTFGGKGANQCVMAAKLDAKTAMIGQIGFDAEGGQVLQNFQDNRVDTRFISRDNAMATGVAFILVERNGVNRIVIVPGANQTFTTDKFSSKDAQDCIASAKVVLVQNEISSDSTLFALRLCKEKSTKGQPIVIYNPAPADPSLDAEFLSLPDYVCLNETELSALTDGLAVDTIKEAEEACFALMRKGAKQVILTMGERGILFVDKNSNSHSIVAKSVNVVDTSGAGDAFLGALAYFIACHPSLSLLSAIERASLIATDTVTRKGTQTSYPCKGELDAALFN